MPVTERVGGFIRVNTPEPFMPADTPNEHHCSPRFSVGISVALRVSSCRIPVEWSARSR
jgi:hypothetical protein